MLLAVYYTPQAERDFLELLDRVAQKWGQASAQKLDAQINEALDQILLHPNLFPELLSRPGLRKCVVTPQTSIFYLIEPDAIVVMRVFDNRQDPQQLFAEQ